MTAQQYHTLLRPTCRHREADGAAVCPRCGAHHRPSATPLKAPHVLTDGVLTYTFARLDRAMVIMRWRGPPIETLGGGPQWLTRRVADADEAWATWRHLRRAGYRPVPRD